MWEVLEGGESAVVHPDDEQTLDILNFFFQIVGDDSDGDIVKFNLLLHQKLKLTSHSSSSRASLRISNTWASVVLISANFLYFNSR